jgi:hypothetical protein
MRRSLFACTLCLVTALSALGIDAFAAGEHSVVGAARSRLATPAVAQAPPAAAAVPQQYIYLIRSTLGALHDANTSGNYTVLRDLSAPSFQAKHSAADLAEIFAAARRKPVDLSAAAFAAPTLSTSARPDPNILHLSGHIPTAHERISFALSFEAIGGHWRLAAVSLATGN